MARDYSQLNAAVTTYEQDVDALDQLNAAHQAAEDDLAKITADRDAQVQAAQKALQDAADQQQAGAQKVAQDRAAVDSAMSAIVTA